MAWQLSEGSSSVVMKKQVGEDTDLLHRKSSRQEIFQAATCSPVARLWTVAFWLLASLYVHFLDVLKFFYVYVKWLINNRSTNSLYRIKTILRIKKNYIKKSKHPVLLNSDQKDQDFLKLRIQPYSNLTKKANPGRLL